MGPVEKTPISNTKSIKKTEKIIQIQKATKGVRSINSRKRKNTSSY
jgi:hypothetical protein